jgi:hypothetical protein
MAKEDKTTIYGGAETLMATSTLLDSLIIAMHKRGFFTDEAVLELYTTTAELLRTDSETDLIAADLLMTKARAFQELMSSTR